MTSWFWVFFFVSIVVLIHKHEKGANFKIMSTDIPYATPNCTYQTMYRGHHEK